MAALERCACCGQTIKAARAPKASDAAEPIAVAEMTTAQLFAHYKKIAPAADCAFVVSIFPELTRLVPAVPTKADARALFDAARHLLTPQPAIDEAAFWSYHRPFSDGKRAGADEYDGSAEQERRANSKTGRAA